MIHTGLEYAGVVISLQTYSNSLNMEDKNEQIECHETRVKRSYI